MTILVQPDLEDREPHVALPMTAGRFSDDLRRAGVPGYRRRSASSASTRARSSADIARAVMDIVADDTLAGEQVTVSNAPAD